MVKKKLIDWKVICAGIFCLTAIEIVALLNGINGVVLSTIIGIIALSIGVAIPKEKVMQ